MKKLNKNLYEDKVVVLAAHLAVVAEKSLESIAQLCLRLAEKAETKATMFRKVHVSILGLKQPSLQQWINRLIEHVDSRYVLFVYQRFLVLIESGLTPEQAFERVITSDVG